jgi:hypothetical protein
MKDGEIPVGKFITEHAGPVKCGHGNRVCGLCVASNQATIRELVEAAELVLKTEGAWKYKYLDEALRQFRKGSGSDAKATKEGRG